MHPEIQHWIDRLQLQPHPEGGFYRETYRAEGSIASLNRCYATAIYFLLPDDQFSAFHRLQSDELWHFYEGSLLHIYVIDKQGKLQVHRLGRDYTRGDSFQAVVPAGCWFASRVPSGSGAELKGDVPSSKNRQRYALAGCTVSPGFDFRDFEMGNRQKLTAAYPQHAELIESLTHG